MIGNLRINLFVWLVKKCVVEKPVNPKCGLHVECVENRHDNKYLSLLVRKFYYTGNTVRCNNSISFSLINSLLRNIIFCINALLYTFNREPNKIVIH